jgi:type I restriction enzyme S subunit
MPFPLPPLAEQQRIVAEVERHMSVIQAAEAVVEANLKRAERLRQAILKRAFEGKLVPQDPSDEPASALLERIRGERALTQGSTTSGKQEGTPRGRARSPGKQGVAL